MDQISGWRGPSALISGGISVSRIYTRRPDGVGWVRSRIGGWHLRSGSGWSDVAHGRSQASYTSLSSQPSPALTFDSARSDVLAGCAVGARRRTSPQEPRI